MKCDICDRKVKIYIVEANLGLFGQLTKDYTEVLCPFEIICRKCKQEIEK